jgi:hypothetical protein
MQSRSASRSKLNECGLAAAGRVQRAPAVRYANLKGQRQRRRPFCFLLNNLNESNLVSFSQPGVFTGFAAKMSVKPCIQIICQNRSIARKYGLEEYCVQTRSTNQFFSGV